LVDDHQAVVLLLLTVLVHQTTTERRHLLAVECLNLGEDAGLHLVASIFTVEDRYSRLVEHGDEVNISRRLERSIRTAPAVRVQTEEVRRGGVVVVALQICPGVF
jgi:hypothetical protein